jgi:N-acetylgalactosamine-N,N'-diacetylbacillosaminyl-diphospho-undecaprenol 4-alpha-N-acetylgalactosaminyltransferase
MKALLINSLTSGGAERIILNIYRKFRDQGKDVVLICLSNNNVYQIFENDKIINLSEANINKKGISLLKVFLFPIVIYKLYRVIKKYGIDTIQSHLFLASAINVITKRVFFLKYKTQIVSHSYMSYEKEFRINGLIKLKILKAVYNSADLLVSISEKMRMDINSNIMNKSNIPHLVIMNPHNIDEIVHNSQLDCPFRFNRQKKYLITCGRLIKLKRIDVLLHALKELNLQDNRYELIILGEGEERSAYEKIINELELKDSVHFPGHVANPFNYIANSDYFLLTSESEGLPNVIIESMLCKTLVISSDCPTGPRELLAPDSNLNLRLKEGIENARYGILTPIAKPKGIVDAINFSNMNANEMALKTEQAFLYAHKFSNELKIIEYEEILFRN